MEADQIAHLVVTSPSDYTITEYSDVTLSGGRPYGITIKYGTGGRIYFAQTANDRLTIFTPPDDWIHLKDPVFKIPEEPYVLTLDNANRVWTTERAGNR